MSFSIKKFRLLALLPLLAAGACSDDPESPMAVDTTTGVYVINNGVQGMHVPGSVTAIDIEKGSATQQAFLARNGVQVGDTQGIDVRFEGDMVHIRNKNVYRRIRLQYHMGC